MNGRAYTSPNPAVATSGGELSVDKLMLLFFWEFGVWSLEFGIDDFLFLVGCVCVVVEFFYEKVCWMKIERMM